MKKVLWFRRDLRIEDSMLLATEGEVLPIFIFDTHILDALPKNDRRVSFIFNHVCRLKKELQHIGLDLALFFGEPKEVFSYLKTLGFGEVYASVDYDSYARERDASIAELMSFHTLNDCYLFEPTEVLKKDGSSYLVFTPYYRACKELYTQFHVLKYIKATQTLVTFDCSALWSIKNALKTALPIALQSIGFEPNLLSIPSPQTLLKALTSKIDNYEQKRDYLAEDATSHLSVHLRFGTISVREIIRFLIALKKEGHTTEPFFRQLIFREFYVYLLYHFPHLAWQNYKYSPPYKENTEAFERFCTAQTGYPLVDAAVMELLSTGNMHNRARMVVGSFFTKHLLLSWQEGEAFFAKHLLDYDASANILSWQWCAGTGIDPQPYFRIFNPYSQSEKFDKDACYIKRYLPQLQNVPAKQLHKEEYLLHNTIKGYVKPIIMHDVARKRFLNLFEH